MTDDELVNEFTRATSTPHGVVIEAATIDWPQPGKPEIIWKPVGLLPIGASVEEMQRHRHTILERPAFFALCQRCHECNPKGWMHDRHICQFCDVDHLGVVYRELSAGRGDLLAGCRFARLPAYAPYLPPSSRTTGAW